MDSANDLPSRARRARRRRTLADVLRGVRSFLVTNDRKGSYPGVRGFARIGDCNGRILLQADGHRVNDTMYDQALLGTEGPAGLDLVEPVEIVRGAGSSRYGCDAFFGAIDLVTRRGRDIGGVEVSALGGTQDTRGGRLTAGGRVGGHGEYVVPATAGRTGSGGEQVGFPVFRQFNDGVAVDSDADRWVKAGLAQPLAGERAVAALETVWQSARKTPAGTTIPAEALTKLVPTAAKPWPGVRVTAAIRNLSDVTLADPAGPEHRQDRIPQPGRQFRLTLDLAFR